MEEFYTLDQANKGTKVPLFTPDGKPTDHYIGIRSVYSEQFRQAEQLAMRSLAEAVDLEDDDEKIKAIRSLTLETIVSLVAFWSFEQECTPDNVREFLVKAPQIADMIDKLSKKNLLHFGNVLNKESKSSETSQEQSSTS
jgi:hypothetical protein